MAQDMVLMRYTDPDGERVAALCRPSGCMESLRSVIGDADETGEDWLRHPEFSGVMIDTSGPVFFSNHEDLAMVANWLLVAARWLESHDD